MKRLFVARHGETDYNRAQRWQGSTDIPLNDEGRAQAAELAERVRHLGLSAVGASTLSRAQETAEIVSTRLGLSLLEPDVRLCERSFGVFEGLTYAECEANFPEVFAKYRTDPTVLPKGAEDYASLTVRARAAVVSAAARASNVLLISHGGVLRALVNSVYEEQKVPRIGNCELYECYVADETIVSVKLVDR